jgi:hypothetical protein
LANTGRRHADKLRLALNEVAAAHEVNQRA